MFNHAQKDYICPICLGIQQTVNKDTLMRPSDIILQDKLVTVFINSFFIKNNPGHVIIVPNIHNENLYDLDVKHAARIIEVSKQAAIALKKEYKCEGVTVLQNNEPAGGQHAFHYHMHIFPRFANDGLHQNMQDKALADPEVRAKYAARLKPHLGSLNANQII